MEGGTLKISGVQESDAGTYSCIASNGIGSSEDKIKLSIGSPPSFLQEPNCTNDYLLEK